MAIVLDGLFFAAALFLPAGTLHWPRAWIFIILVVAAAALTIYRLPEDLLNERLKGPIQKKQPVVDKIILIFFLTSYTGTIVFSGLDVFHYHLLAPPPMAAAVLGLVLYLLGWWLAAAAILENSFATAVVRLQEERGHRLVDTGPYRCVRHPMYSGLIPMAIGAPLWLGSYAAALAGLIPILLIAVRILFEERFLRRELPGYPEYTQRTRYRLIPFLW